jgi:hypothetical protein
MNTVPKEDKRRTAMMLEKCVRGMVENEEFPPAMRAHFRECQKQQLQRARELS